MRRSGPSEPTEGRVVLSRRTPRRPARARPRRRARSGPWIHARADAFPGRDDRYPAAVPYFICPRCKERTVDIDAQEGFSRQAPACRHCGFGFLFELMDDYYPGPNTGLVVCDQDGRVLATGEGVFELTGYRETTFLGKNFPDAVPGEGDPPAVALKGGVRNPREPAILHTRAG